MSEFTQSDQALRQMRRWRDDYRNSLAPSPLEDISQLSAQLDLTHAHPSGIAQLFASGKAPLDSLFRDTGMLRAAGRRLERVYEDQTAKSRISGVAELSMVVGVATWSGKSVPVLLYPVDVTRKPGGGETDATIKFTGRGRLNPAFVTELHDQGVNLDEDELFDGSNYDNGTPETSAVFAAIEKQARRAFADFDIDRYIIVGCFMDPSAQILLESQRIIDALRKGPTGNTMLDALAGDAQAIHDIESDKIPEYSPFDGDPHAEYEVGDVDNTVRYAANVVAAGHSIVLDSEVGNGSAAQAAAIASRCIMNGRSVLYVPCVAEQKRRFTKIMGSNVIGDLVLDIADEQGNLAIDKQLIAAVGYRAGNASSRFDQMSDELVGVRSRLTRYLGDLHGVNERWGVSAYQTIQNLASIATLPTHPATHVRLSDTAARTLNGHMDEWANKLRAAGELGEYTVGPDDTAWYQASLTTEEQAVNAYQRVVDLMQKLLPATREQVATTVQTCGFPVPTTAQEWGRQVTVLKNLRRVLDVFQPEIFERDIDSMIEASKSKQQRKSEGSDLGFWERRRLVKEAKSLLRVGAQVENLHDALVVVAKQSEQWHLFVPHGGWPVLPPKLDTILETQDALMRNITSLDAVLATTPKGGNLESLDFNTLEERLKALYNDHMALDTLPGRCLLEQEFRSVGLDELVDDLRARRVPVEAVEGELQLSWWTTVFEDIVKQSAIISNQDGSALQTAADRFGQVDTEHVRSIGPMIHQESLRKLCDLLFSKTQEANQLHTVLAGGPNTPLGRVLRDHPQIMALAKPVLMATPSTLAALTDPTPLADVAIIDAAAHMPAIELLSIICRARQIVIIAHDATVTSPSVKTLIGLLPHVEARPRLTRRSPRLSAFLQETGYGPVRRAVPTEGMQGMVRLHRIEATGVPVISSGLVESSQQEIETVTKLICDRAKSFTVVPVSYVLTVVTMTEVFRTRLGAELKSLASKDKTMGRFLRHVRLIGLDEVAGAQATDVIVSMCYAKTTHGRLIQQFGPLEGDGGKGMLLDALALADRNLDIVASFGPEDMDDERLHQSGPRLLKQLLSWASTLDATAVRPTPVQVADNVLFNDLAQRVKARGLEVAVDYGFSDGVRIPLVVGAKGKPFALAVLTDDAQFMGMQSTRERHRLLPQELARLGWSAMTVWSVAAFVNPDKEVDRMVARIGTLYGEA